MWKDSFFSIYIYILFDLGDIIITYLTVLLWMVRLSAGQKSWHMRHVQLLYGDQPQESFVCHQNQILREGDRDPSFTKSISMIMHRKFKSKIGSLKILNESTFFVSSFLWSKVLVCYIEYGLLISKVVTYN